MTRPEHSAKCKRGEWDEECPACNAIEADQDAHTDKQENDSMKNDHGQGEVAAAIAVMVATLTVFVGVPFAWVASKEWRKDVSGRAQLAEAKNASKVKTERARADVESAKLNAKAEIARARGTAKAVEIENGAITESYTNYLYVKNLRKANVVYVPTEAGLPILEAGKHVG